MVNSIRKDYPAAMAAGFQIMKPSIDNPVMAAARFSNPNELAEFLKRYLPVLDCLLFFMEGDFILQSGQKYLKISAPSLHYCSSGCHIAITSENPTMASGICIAYNAESTPASIRQHEAAMPLSRQQAALLQCLCQEPDEGDYLSHLSFVFSAYITGGSVVKKMAQIPEHYGYTNHYIKQFYNLVDMYYKEQRSMEFYADRLCISRGHLRKLMRKHADITPKTLIRQRLVSEGASLLLTTDLPIKQLAYELGFMESNAFSLFFKKYAGLSPSFFRLHHLK